MKFILQLIGCLLLLSCEQELIPIESAQEDNSPPELMLYSPHEGESFDRDSEILIELDVVENFKLHDVLVQVFKTENDSLVWEYYAHTHQKGIEIREKIPSGLLHMGSYMLTVEGQDHDYNLEEIQRQFVVR
ncbi:MAG: hypothetical protein MRZ79_07940 [Bacteroidia bacterium]|nr:hypothetical protein [Bacteroidia bacterium]